MTLTQLLTAVVIAELLIISIQYCWCLKRQEERGRLRSEITALKKNEAQLRTSLQSMGIQYAELRTCLEQELANRPEVPEGPEPPPKKALESVRLTAWERLRKG